MTLILTFEFVPLNAATPLTQASEAVMLTIGKGSDLAPKTAFPAKVGNQKFLSLSKLKSMSKKLVPLLDASLVIGFLVISFVPFTFLKVLNNEKILNAPKTSPPSMTYSAYWAEQNMDLDFLVKSQVAELGEKMKAVIPNYTAETVLFKNGRVTYEGRQILAAYLLLVDTGKAKPFPELFFRVLDTQDAMMIAFTKERLKAKPAGTIINENEVSGIEKTESDLGFVYEWVERTSEPGLFNDRFRDFDQFKSHFENETGISFKDYIQSFDEYYNILWEETLNKNPSVNSSDKDAFRDYAFLMSVYHMLHRFYDDSYIVEGITNATPFAFARERILHKPADGSLGVFQGYDKGVAHLLSTSPRILNKIGSIPDLKDSALKWKGKNQEQIYEELKGHHFWFGAASPQSFHWQMSMLGQIAVCFEYYTDVNRITQSLPNASLDLKVTLALTLRKSKNATVRHYIYKQLEKDFEKAKEGEFVKIPFDRSHFYNQVLAMLRDQKEVKAFRSFQGLVFYWQKGATALPGTLEFQDSLVKESV